MASQNVSKSKTNPPFKRPHVSRRKWTRPEEDVLINALKDLVVNGWRSDNAFRSRYLRQLEEAMAKRFPNANISGIKHINSKMTVRKKTYGQLSGICNTSEFGFNEEENMIEIEDEVWENYVKVHPEVESLRNKNFPFYNDWKIIFGTDRATGEAACEFKDAILELQHPHEEDDVVYSPHVLNGAKGKKYVDGEPKTPTVNLQEEDLDEDTSNLTDSYATKGKRKMGSKEKYEKKRKTYDGSLFDPLVEVVKDLFNKNNEILEGLSSKYSTDRSAAAEKCRQVHEIVDAMVGLPIVARVRAEHKIVSVPHNTDLFLSMDAENRAIFVHLALDNQI